MLEKENGTKVPKLASRLALQAGSSTDVSKHRTFEEAIEAYRTGMYDGVGRAIMADERFVGVDFDDCINPETGEISPWPREAIESIGSDAYFEVSPSETGVKGWIKGNLEGSRERKDGDKKVEIYGDGRFFAVTGWLFGTGSDVPERQAELDAFLAREGLDKKKQQPRETGGDTDSKNGFDLTRFLRWGGVDVLEERHDREAAVKYEIECPWSEEHTHGREVAYVGQYEDGATWFNCYHAHCADRKWQEFRQLITERRRQQEREEKAAEAWDQAKALAKSEDILSEVYALQQQDGLVGEETNAKIMQLVAVTRYKGQPMSVIVGGESSGGKSYLLKETAKTLPEDALHTLQSISDKALAYIGENTLSHKFLLIYELGGLGKEGEQGLEMVKQLLTEGRIDRQIAESTPKGVQGRRVYAEGPTGLWTTTTKNVIDGELQNRALTLTIDESPEQTARIIKGRKGRKKRQPADFGPVKALHTWLAGHPGDVDVPFEGVIAEAVDPRAVRMRRFYDYVMELVEAHALLHRATRAVDADGFVIAKPEDYAAVYRLLKDILAVAAEVSVSDKQRQTVEASKKVVESEKPLTADTLAEELGIARSSASRRLGAATREGYLKHDPDAGSKAKVYVMGEGKLPDKATPAIPDPEKFWDAMQAAYEEVCNCANCARTPTPSSAEEVKSELKCAQGVCTHAAHIESEEHGLPQKADTYADVENGPSVEKSNPGPSVHTLHSCAVEENGSENGSVHGSVQAPVHSWEADEDDEGLTI